MFATGTGGYIYLEAPTINMANEYNLQVTANGGNVCD